MSTTMVSRSEVEEIRRLARAGLDDNAIQARTGRCMRIIWRERLNAGVNRRRPPNYESGSRGPRPPRTTVEIDPGTRRRLLAAENGLKAGSAVETIRRLLELGGF